MLLHEALNGLCIKKQDRVYLDCTFGRGGHSQAILASLGEFGRLIGLDRDPSAVSVGMKLAQEDPRFQMIHTAFSKLEGALDKLGVERLEGILMDLGVSATA